MDDDDVDVRRGRRRQDPPAQQRMDEEKGREPQAIQLLEPRGAHGDDRSFRDHGGLEEVQVCARGQVHPRRRCQQRNHLPSDRRDDDQTKRQTGAEGAGWRPRCAQDAGATERESDGQPAQRGRVVKAVRDLQGMAERRDAQGQAGERDGIGQWPQPARHRAYFSSRNSSASPPSAGNVP
jgi:hypothetical protein